MNMKRLLVLSAVGVLGIAWGSTQRGRVKMGELHASLAQSTGLDGDPLDKTPVEFEQIGKPDYDQFFVESARVQAGLVVSNALVESLTKNVKAFAMSFAAANATDANIKKLLNGQSTDQIGVDEAFALLKLKKARTGLSQDEVKYAARTGANTLQTAVYLRESVVGTKAVIEKGQSLSGRVKTDFTGFDMAKAPGVTSALTTSLNNLGESVKTAPEIAKQLTRLAQGLQAL